MNITLKFESIISFMKRERFQHNIFGYEKAAAAAAAERKTLNSLRSSNVTSKPKMMSVRGRRRAREMEKEQGKNSTMAKGNTQESFENS